MKHLLMTLLLATFVTGCGTSTFVKSPAERPQSSLLMADAQYWKWWVNRPTDNAEVEFLARSLSAEARGEVTRYKKTGNANYRASVVGAGYVIARTAAAYKTTVQNLVQGGVKSQPNFLSAWYLQNRAGNAENYSQFFLPTSQIENWDDLVAISREALAGKDPSGIDPNHYYDDSLQYNPPRWAVGDGVVKQPLGHFIFVYTPKDL
ncbi:MAG TPA: hypothetical protein V6D05_10245 [Stenomitos sp.]